MSTTQPRSRLDRAQVIAAAIAHADECGLEATSMRKVAERLHVTPMALYKHVENRSELIDEMLDHVLALLPRAGGPGRVASPGPGTHPCLSQLVGEAPVDARGD
ncbi:TetR/AcrR family transcriptional regulator [Propioniciclava flava]